MTTGIYVTLTGLQMPTLEALLSSCAEDQRLDIEPNIDTDPESPVGQMNGIFCSHLREAWEVLAIAYNGFNPDAAEDFTLDALCALTGTSKRPATPSRFYGAKQLTLDLDAATTVPAGTAFTVQGNPSIRFTLDADITSTVAGFYLVDATCTQLGPINCNANTLTVIATPVVGLIECKNLTDVRLGTDEDTNQQLRLRREAELRATGAGTLDSIRADVLEIELTDGSFPIINVTTFENQTMITDVITGLPPKSIEVLVFDGVTPACPDDTIAQVIWKSKPGGIEMVGTSSGTAIDGTGANQTVPFSRPTIQGVKFNIALSVNTETYVGDQACLTAVANYFILKVRQGGLIRARDYVKTLMLLPGVLDVTTMQIAFLPDAFPANETNLQLGLREMGEADTSNMVLSTTPGVP